MGIESVNEPCDPVEGRSSWLGQRVNLLMVALSNKLGIFEEYGGFNPKDKSEGGSVDREDMENQLKK